MPATAEQGALSALYVEPGAAPHTFDGSSERYEFLNSTLRLEANHIDNDAIRGTRSHAEETIREGTEQVSGSIVLNPSPADLDLWQPNRPTRLLWPRRYKPSVCWLTRLAKLTSSPTATSTARSFVRRRAGCWK